MVVMFLYRTLRKVTSTNMRKKHVRRDSKMCCCCCCCRFCCGAPTTDEGIHPPVLHDASQIAYCRYWGRASLPPITCIYQVCIWYVRTLISDFSFISLHDCDIFLVVSGGILPLQSYRSLSSSDHGQDFGDEFI